jgi:hypothetical protein
MNKRTQILIAAGLLAAAANSPAAQVAGDVKSVVLAGSVIQTNVGIGNRNRADLGSVSGAGSVGGSLKSVVVTGTVYQSNKGIGQRNGVSIGSVTY